MKYLFIYSFLFLYFPASSQDHRPEKLAEYLQQQDMFALRAAYDKAESKLPVERKLYYKSFIDNAFNENESSIKQINLLMKDYEKKLSPKEAISLLNIQVDNYAKTYQYRMAAATGKFLFTKYAKDLDTATLADQKNTTALLNSLSGVAPQQITLKKTSLAWKRDQVGLMNIPVVVNGQTTDFVFDTGANLSTITESYAKKLQLKRIESSIDLGSGTTISNKASIAIASSLFIGETELKNVVFLVLPDEQMAFPQLNYAIKGIIGFPVINQLGEVRIHKKGTMTIPGRSTKSKMKNLALAGLLPIISIQTDRDTLSYHFDTGAKQTSLFKKYFDKYKAGIESSSKADTIGMAGAGGFVKIKVFKLPHFNFYMGARKESLSDVNVLTTPNGEGEYYYGNIGQDLIGKFEEMILNFKEMYIDFR